MVKGTEKPLECVLVSHDGDFCVTVSEDTSAEVLDKIQRFNTLLLAHSSFVDCDGNTFHYQEIMDANYLRKLEYALCCQTGEFVQLTNEDPH